MRLDKYLKLTRLIKRRTVANEACDADRVLVNGKVAGLPWQSRKGTSLKSTWAAVRCGSRCSRSVNMSPRTMRPPAIRSWNKLPPFMHKLFEKQNSGIKGVVFLWRKPRIPQCRGLRT